MPPAYRLAATAAQIAQATGAQALGDVWGGGEVIVGGYAPVIIADKTQGRHLIPRQWGVPPPPRGEHLVPFVSNLDSPFWIGTLRHSQFRCLVPMTHFRKGAQWFTHDHALFACAGIWRDSEIPSFAILTAGAMPVILTPDNFAVWLHSDIKLARKLIA